MKLTVLSFSLLGVLIIASCTNQEQEVEQKPKYLRWVGDSVYDPEIDDPTFAVCHGEGMVKQYFNFSQGFKYNGERSTLLEKIYSRYEPVDVDESGWIRIRFVVNCKGQAGRFRLTQSDENYKERAFDQRISSQLMSIVQSLSGWALMPSAEKPEDYYLYLLFKIENGNITEVLP